MTITPFLDASLALQLHMIAAVPAVIVGPFVLFRRRVDMWHKRLGYVWLTAMVVLAIAGLFIPSEFAMVGMFGPLHAFSVITLYSVAAGLRYAIIGNIAAHGATLRGLWIGGIGAAGLMQFLPGRTIHMMVFGRESDAGYLLIGTGAVALVYLLWTHRPRTKVQGPRPVSRTA
ncbi:DUF2306 domain-containing protein [Nereida sp. MMG025]|uniref:DUF2306 domain-containing protein n=1 Tax=Nereida sp. MMG025 TaxID=2909981 RepID=UPI001F1EE4BD|nr:DUF2306 domain-containing protein [Nereida sp. MMG025]MCF6443769.1 DUF2306 domain-containing protein [Nereida sp. MMG025]